jgi:hypothetical protein
LAHKDHFVDEATRKKDRQSNLHPETSDTLSRCHLGPHTLPSIPCGVGFPVHGEPPEPRPGRPSEACVKGRPRLWGGAKEGAAGVAVTASGGQGLWFVQQVGGRWRWRASGAPLTATFAYLANGAIKRSPSVVRACPSRKMPQLHGSASALGSTTLWEDCGLQPPWGCPTRGVRQALLCHHVGGDPRVVCCLAWRTREAGGTMSQLYNVIAGTLSRGTPNVGQGEPPNRFLCT